MSRLHPPAAAVDASQRHALEQRELGDLLMTYPDLRRLMRAVRDLALASDPTPTRNLDGSHRARRQFDQPLPHQPTERNRYYLERLMRSCADLADAAETCLDPVHSDSRPSIGDICPTCGTRPQGRHHQLKTADCRTWLDIILADGPVEATHIARLARQEGYAIRTLERASTRRPRIDKYWHTTTQADGAKQRLSLWRSPEETS